MSDEKFKLTPDMEPLPMKALKDGICIHCKETLKKDTRCVWIAGEGLLHDSCLGGPNLFHEEESELTRERKQELLEGCTEMCIKVLVQKGSPAERHGGAVMTASIGALEGYVMVHAAYEDSPDGEEMATFLEVLEDDDVDWRKLG